MGGIFWVDQIHKAFPDTERQGYTNNVKTALCSKNLKQPCANASIQLSAKADKMPSKAQLTLKDDGVRTISAQAFELTVWVEMRWNEIGALHSGMYAHK